MSERQAERRKQWRQMIAEQEKSGESIRDPGFICCRHLAACSAKVAVNYVHPL